VAPRLRREAVVARANAHVTYPARFQLVAAMNPCRCGYLSDAARACNKAPRCAVEYQSKISGPLFDRFDMAIDVPDVPTLAETVPGYETGTWWGIGVPIRTAASSTRATQAATACPPTTTWGIPAARSASDARSARSRTASTAAIILFAGLLAAHLLSFGLVALNVFGPSDEQSEDYFMRSVATEVAMATSATGWKSAWGS
jgi:Mg-chelatase subunit ChlI